MGGGMREVCAVGERWGIIMAWVMGEDRGSLGYSLLYSVGDDLGSVGDALGSTGEALDSIGDDRSV